MLIYISIILLIVGTLFKLFPPKKINAIYGYRTLTSMKDQYSWDMAQKIGALGFLILGLWFSILELTIKLTNYKNDVLELIIFLVSMIGMFVVDEIVLKNKIKQKKQ